MWFRRAIGTAVVTCLGCQPTSAPSPAAPPATTPAVAQAAEAVRTPAQAPTGTTGERSSPDGAARPAAPSTPQAPVHAHADHGAATHAGADESAPLLRARRGTPDLAATVDDDTGLRLVSARLEEGVTRVVVSWPPLDPSRFKGWVLEAAPTRSGPFKPRAEGKAGGETPGTATVPIAQPMAWFRLVRLPNKGEPQHSSPIRALAVTADHYDLGRRTVPYAPDHQARVKAMVRRPAALADIEGTLPLAVITHGNAGVCRNSDGEDICEMSMVLEDKCPEGKTPTPSAEGFVWLAENLAARGYVVIVVDANSVNCTHLPLVVQGRTSLIMEHLKLWSRAVRGLDSPLGTTYLGKLDFTRLGLIGHSNGAEASAMVPAALQAARLQPQLAGARVAAVVAIAGSDSLWAMPDEAAFLVLQPSCDMQLPAQDGLRLYDRSQTMRVAPHSVAYIVGGTHNGFNQRWHRDESLDEPSGQHYSACPESEKIAPWRQRALLDAVVGDWMLATVRERRRVVPAWLRGDAPMPKEIVAAVGGPIDVRWSHGPADKLIIESFDGEDAPRKNDLGGTNRVAGFSNGGRCYAIRCDDEFAHASWGGRFDWEAAGARFLFELPELDASSWGSVSVRMTQNPGSNLNRPGRAIDASVRMVDAGGNVATVALSAVGGLRWPSLMARSNENVRFYHGVMESVRIPIARFTAAEPNFQPHRLVGVELVFDRPGSEQGSITVGHVELSRP